MSEPLFQDLENRTIFVADNLEVMRKMDDEVVDLIYLDPPFGTMDTWKANNEKKILETKNYFKKLQSENRLFLKEDFDDLFKEVKFKDIWEETDVNRSWQEELMERDEKLFSFIDGIDFAKKKEGGKFYLFYMAIRLLEMKRILKQTGSIYLHCDEKMGHYLKGVMDLIFNYNNFRNEIAWCYDDTPGRPETYFARKHDTIFFYSKDKDRYKFYDKSIRIPIKEESKKRYESPRVLGGRATVGGKSASEGKVPESWWRYPNVKGNSLQAAGYRTQKPLALLERIIKASSKEGDVVLDPFCGCATTCIAAESLKRKWIGIDKNRVAFFLNYYRMRTRFLETIKNPKKQTGETLFDEAITVTESFDDTALQEKLILNLKKPRETLPQLSDRQKDQEQNHKIEADKKIDAEYKKELLEKKNILRGKDKAAYKKNLLAEQRNRCRVCKAKLYDSYHLDRIIPKSEGGEYLEGNMQILCMTCNLSKGGGSNLALAEKLFEKKKIDSDIFFLNIQREFNEQRIDEDTKKRLLEKAEKAKSG